MVGGGGGGGGGGGRGGQEAGEQVQGPHGDPGVLVLLAQTGGLGYRSLCTSARWCPSKITWGF